MKSNPDELKRLLFSANDGRDACDAINKLAALAKKGNEDARKVMGFYVSEGSIGHMRTHACARLAETVKEPNAEFAELFRRGLTDPEVRYWCTLGYLKCAGRSAYDELIRMAIDKSIRLEERAHAIKCIARFSKRHFDRGLPSDPGHWKETDLRLSELNAWAKGGYQDGEGYMQPIRHPSLDDPNTEFEMIASRLDKKLAKERKKRQDLAEPTNWLTIANPGDIARIKGRWGLPSTYLDFITHFSPLRVIVKGRRFYNCLFLFGANELIEEQKGYSVDPTEGEPLVDWPPHYVVFASHGGDPYVLDLSTSDGTDALVLTARHGEGSWEFKRVAKSFREFLEQLTK